MILGLIVMIEKFILKQKLAARISLKLITFPFIASLQEIINVIGTILYLTDTSCILFV